MISTGKDGSGPLYLQIYSQLKQDIACGALAEGTVLTGSRMLATMLGVSRNTVDNAYSQLVAEGYIAARRGVGFVVQHVPSIDAPATPSGHAAPQAAQCPTQPETGAQMQAQAHGQPLAYDLTNSSHTVELFPKSLWKKFTFECLEMM